MQQNIEERKEELAYKAIGAARDNIVMKLRYLEAAVYALKPVSKPDITGISTDGENFYFETRSIIRRCSEGISKLTHDYLHLLMHCIFLHTKVTASTDAEIWNIATDIAVEDVILQMCKDIFPGWHSERQINELKQIKLQIGELTAERIYDYFMNDMPRKLTREQLYMMFHCDEHKDWYDEKSLNLLEIEESGAGSIKQQDEGGTPIDDIEENEHDDGNDWERIAETIKMSAELGALNDEMKFLTEAIRTMDEKIASYSDFLKHFAVRREVMRVDDASFDYIFYTLGMELYGDMPLVEPLEFADDKIIDDLVIVIDSSASTSGKLVEEFIEQTFQILHEEDVLGNRFSIRILQCDKKIQEDVTVHNRREAERYLTHMKIKGLGGTDFRAAFRYIDELNRHGEFHNLKGIVYFTDGKGIFPGKKPPCETAFVFANKETAVSTEIPFWAIKAVLGNET